MNILLTLSNINYLKDLYKYPLIKGIIIGQKDFSNRFNKYYNDQELNTIINTCNKYNLDIYLSINDIIHQNQLDKLDNYINKISKLPFKGIYFNDISIITLARKYNILNKLIYNPDTLLTNYHDCNFHLNNGILAIQLSKEITLDDIINCLKNTKNVHYIIHGYLNMSYSKRPFLKSYFQYINKSYNYLNNYNLRLIEATRNTKMPILEDDKYCSVFTDFILESYNQIDILTKYNLQYGIIDDIFLDKEHLFDILDLYHNHIDYNLFINKYNSFNYSNGYYYKKTNLVK